MSKDDGEVIRSNFGIGVKLVFDGYVRIRHSRFSQHMRAEHLAQLTTGNKLLECASDIALPTLQANDCLYVLFFASSVSCSASAVSFPSGHST